MYPIKHKWLYKQDFTKTRWIVIQLPAYKDKYIYLNILMFNI